MKRPVVLACLFVLTCGPSVQPPAPVAPRVAETPVPPASLYERLGGLPAITLVVDDFVRGTMADPRIAQRFFNVDATRLKRLLVELVCSATGGPCEYTGRDMTGSHARMQLVDDEFTALVENFVAALDRYQVPVAERTELLAALGRMRGQIVVAPGMLHPIDEARLAAVGVLAERIQDPAAHDLLSLAVLAGRRGQRSYAEQLFTRAEMLTGPAILAPVAATFRAGAPRQ